MDGLPPVGMVAGSSIFTTLLSDALRSEGVDLRDDPTRPLLVVVPPPTVGELYHPTWTTRVDALPVSVPMVVLALPELPVQVPLADRVRSGRASILDATTARVDTIVSMLRLAADGRQVVDRPFAPDASTNGVVLSESERGVLALVAAGLSNRAIAAQRYVAERTIETHVRQIFRKLGLVDGPDVNRRVLATRRYLDGDLGPR